MRYYDISISTTPGGPPISLPSPSGTSQAWWQSHPGGRFNPAALDVEFDIYTAPYATPLGNSFIRVWGVDLATLKNAVVLSGATPQNFITIKGGMRAGLPLANPSQAGVLASGMVWQSFGNWSGTDMTLDLQLNAGGSSLDRPVNLVLNWQKGQPLSTALQNCLSTAFPGTKITISISQNLVATSTVQHMASTLTGLAQLVESLSRTMLGKGSLGVQIVQQSGGIIVFDGTATQTPKQLVFTDLVGQPTWLKIYELCVQTVMRGDIQVGDTIKLPPELSRLGPFVLTQPQSYPAYRDQSAIQGTFFVTQIRQLGRFRSPYGVDWSTTLICVPLPPEGQQ